MNLEIYYVQAVQRSSTVLGINRLCSATFEQLLAFSATFCTASNGQQLEQLFLPWQLLSQKIVKN